jgi:hypothetical protein
VGDGLGDGVGEGEGAGVGVVLSFRPPFQPHEQLPLSLTWVIVSELPCDATARCRSRPVTLVLLQAPRKSAPPRDSARADDRNGRDMGNLQKDCCR